MRFFRYIIVTVLPLIFSGCIHNDLPYPIIFGGIEEITFSGASEVKVDNQNMVVNVTFSDTVDLRKIEVTSFKSVEDSRSTLAAGDILNLCKSEGYGVGEPYDFTISTFQDYKWKIVANQPILREIKLSGSIGSALFDYTTKTAVVNVASSQDLYSITVEKFALAPSVATYSPDPFQISNFSHPVQFMVSYFGIEELWTISVQHSLENVVTGTSNPWATFAYLYGDVLPTSTFESGFEYRETSFSTWNRVASTNKSGKIEAVIKDLKPNTSYTYRAYLGSENGAEMTFTTEITPTVPNLNFDEAYFESGCWYFNASGGNSYWATGNEGIKTAGKSASTTSVEGSEAVSGKAVKMVTYNNVIMVSVAAGNLFTGTYKTIMSANPSEALKSATMGRPYSGRPTSLSGWYKYSPEVLTSKSYWAKAATEFGMNFADSVGKKDWCQIYVVLEQWPEGAEVRPSEDMITRVAYGEIRTNQEVPQYTPFTIELDYNDLTTIPNHISIVASSSLNGGYFCGAAGSCLYVDDFSISYDYIEQ